MNLTEDELPFVFNMLSDPTRLKLIHLLPKSEQDRPLNVCELGKILGIPQPNLSHHLKLLRCAGLIQCDKREGCSYYRVDAPKVREALELVLGMLANQPQTPGSGPPSPSTAGDC